MKRDLFVALWETAWITIFCLTSLLDLRVNIFAGVLVSLILVCSNVLQHIPWKRWIVFLLPVCIVYRQMPSAAFIFMGDLVERRWVLYFCIKKTHQVYIHTILMQGPCSCGGVNFVQTKLSVRSYLFLLYTNFGRNWGHGNLAGLSHCTLPPGLMSRWITILWDWSNQHHSGSSGHKEKQPFLFHGIALDVVLKCLMALIRASQSM